jgi:hypothetical protein
MERRKCSVPFGLGRCSEFTGKPPRESRFHRVARNDFVLYGAASRTFEQAMVKADGARANARKHHARRAVRTSRALNWNERWAGGKISLWHNTSPCIGRERAALSVTDKSRRRCGDGREQIPFLFGSRLKKH